MLTAAWVNFFTGFVVGKVPFPLTQRFQACCSGGSRSCRALDVTYISSLSWYFLNFFGLRGVLRSAPGRTI